MFSTAKLSIFYSSEKRKSGKLLSSSGNFLKYPNRYNNEKFPTSHYTTLGTEFIVKEITVDGESVRAKIWDTAGQERFRTITKSFYQQAHGVLLAYDVTNKETYEKLGVWIQNINEKAEANVVKFLVATKIDLIDDRVVTPEEGKTIARQYDMQYIETSALTNQNVKEAFEAIIEKVHIVRRHDPQRASFPLANNKERTEKKKGCC